MASLVSPVYITNTSVIYFSFTHTSSDTKHCLVFCFFLLIAFSLYLLMTMSLILMLYFTLQITKILLKTNCKLYRHQITMLEMSVSLQLCTSVCLTAVLVSFRSGPSFTADSQPQYDTDDDPGEHRRHDSSETRRRQHDRPR